MTVPALRLFQDPRYAQLAVSRSPSSIANTLLEWDALLPDALEDALEQATSQGIPLRDVLLSENTVSADLIAEATAVEMQTSRIDLRKSPPDARLIDEIGADVCLRLGFVPCKMMGQGLMLATARPEALDQIADVIPGDLADAHISITTQADVENAILRQRSRSLVERSEHRPLDNLSSRNWGGPRMVFGLGLASFVMISGILMLPKLVFALICGWAIVTLVLLTLLKIASITLYLRSKTPPPQPRPAPPTAPLPRVSIIVPLFREEALAAHLVKRLALLDYPRALLEICLVTEADDKVTRETISKTDLPGWFRVISVPKGTIKTKPRALNYALDFCRGSIIGVYDAEDAPDPDQLRKVVARFEACPSEVVCLQGILDFYNAGTNWLSRCFTIEYASWFRVMLPGLQKLGFAIPLGGTTMFFRRAALEKLGAWDAHNVTEDADLGIRLARAGYRAEIIQTVTKEEANCRAIPWVRQRSRWLKGYAITWAVHMRSPATLIRDLGWWRFFGMQLIFLGALSQFVLAPFLWSFWLSLFGYWHPMDGYVSRDMFLALGALFFAGELIGILAAGLALNSGQHRWLIKWTPTLFLYFPLGTLASYKGLWETLSCPYYWDKTCHGIFPAQPPPTRKRGL